MEIAFKMETMNMTANLKITKVSFLLLKSFHCYLSSQENAPRAT